MAWDGSMFGYAPGVNYNAQPAPAATPPAQPAPPQQASLPQPPGSGGVTPPDQLSRWMQMLFGNDRNPGSGGQLADAGGGGQQQGAAAGSTGQPAGWNWGPNQGINLGSLGAGALQAATMLPKVGTIASLAQMLMRGYNVANADAVRTSFGTPNQDIGQIIGGVLGLNNRGSLSGNQTFANNEGEYRNPITGAPVAVTQGGMYDQGFLGGGPFGMFSDMRSAYTAPEAVSHNNLARAPGYGNPVQGQMYSGVIGPTPSGQPLQATVAPGTPPGYVPYTGPLSNLPGGVLWKNGQAYVQGGGNGGGTDLNGNPIAGSYSGRDTSSPYGAGDTTSRNSVTGMLGHI